MQISLTEHFSVIKDHRQKGKIEHPLTDILLLCICAVICGAEGWADIEEFGHSRCDWLQSLGLFKNGIPVDDTIARVISSLNPKHLQKCFINWMGDVSKITRGEVIAIDGKTVRRSFGKTVRRSFDKKSRRSALHMVSAFACSNGVVLGQEKTHQKSNEITAIPALLKLLQIKGCIITIDAMGCQKNIASKIIAAGGDYALAVKGNQKHLYEDIKDFFKRCEQTDFDKVKYGYHEEIDKGHGRIEIRRYWITDELICIGKHTEWAGLNTIGMAENETHKNGKITKERRYFIVSFEVDAKRFGHAVRSHWGIENRLHWVLDMSFREDESRIRRGNATENFCVFRHFSLNLLRQEKTSKRGIKGKRYKAALNTSYAEKVLSPLF